MACENHYSFRSNCSPCMSAAFKIFGSLFGVLLYLIHALVILFQLERAGVVCGADPTCLDNLPSGWQAFNPLNIHIWNIDYLKLDFTGSVIGVYMNYIYGSLFDLGAGLLMLGAVIFFITYGWTHLSAFLSRTKIKNQFKEQDLRLELQTKFDEKSAVADSKVKALAAPNAGSWRGTVEEVEAELVY